MKFKNIYLIGFMGAGKTTIGRILAEQLRWKFVDMDILLVKKFDMPISEYFAKFGEPSFRDRETELLQELSLKKHMVIATGGGVPVREQNREIMKSSGTIIYLETDISTCKARVSQKQQAKRPLWQDEKSLSELLESRKPAYAHNNMSISVIGKKHNEIVADILKFLN